MEFARQGKKKQEEPSTKQAQTAQEFRAPPVEKEEPGRVMLGVQRGLEDLEYVAEKVERYLDSPEQGEESGAPPTKVSTSICTRGEFSQILAPKFIEYEGGVVGREIYESADILVAENEEEAKDLCQKVHKIYTRGHRYHANEVDWEKRYNRIEVYEFDRLTFWEMFSAMATPEYLGEAASKLAREHPPQVLTVHTGDTGAQLYNTNIIILDYGLMEDPDLLSTYNKERTIMHELHHYFSRIMRGGTDFREVGGGKVKYWERPAWLDEGLIEMHAEQYPINMESPKPDNVAYAVGVAVAVYLQKVMQMRLGDERGKEALRHAFLSGDFSMVHKIVDSVLGRGTFEGVALELEPERALLHIEGKLSRSKIDYYKWNKEDMLLKRIRQVAREEEERDEKFRREYNLSGEEYNKRNILLTPSDGR